jgi:hypothetical protein
LLTKQKQNYSHLGPHLLVALRQKRTELSTNSPCPAWLEVIESYESTFLRDGVSKKLLAVSRSSVSAYAPIIEVNEIAFISGIRDFSKLGMA